MQHPPRHPDSSFAGLTSKFRALPVVKPSIATVPNHAAETGEDIENSTPAIPPSSSLSSLNLHRQAYQAYSFPSTTRSQVPPTNTVITLDSAVFSFAMTSAAQEEFNELVRDKDRESRHPEDRHDSDHSEPESSSADFYPEKQDTDDELDIPKDMRSNYYLPSIRSDANTGPKGVIADAHAFEQAKKQARRFTWRKNSPPSSYTVTAYHDEKASSDDDSEDSFMKRWRESRLRELQNAGQRIRSRTTSPSRRIYGNLPTVDGEGYLEAIEKVARDTIVVVFIYDDTVCSPTSAMHMQLTNIYSPKSPPWSKTVCVK